MPTAAFTTLGCKVNQYETQKILEGFEALGFEIVPFEGPSDVYVVNTCSVTSDAERKSRYVIRRANRHNPNAKVVVTGCAAQMALNKCETMLGADLVVPNPVKETSATLFARHFPDLLPPIHPVAEPTHAHNFAGRTRATLKLQDGCSVYCSYCSIPYTRPRMVSRPADEVLAEAKKLAQMGYLEIVLTGVLIGSFGPETGSGGPNFVSMVRQIAEESGIPRVRISSIEMQQVSDELIDLISDGLVVPHLHIPLQSGDTHVLRDMNRPYDQDDYLRLCERIQQRVPGISLTTDIMVGFPTEDAPRFESSVEVCRRVGFLKAHVFSFSPRYGTAADAWGDPIPPEEKARRREVLMTETKTTAETHAQHSVGRTLRVLVEGKTRSDGVLEGLSDHYLTVRFVGPAALSRTLQWVRIDEVRNGVALGERVGAPLGHR